MPPQRHISTPALLAVAQMCHRALCAPTGTRLRYLTRAQAVAARATIYACRKQLGYKYEPDSLHAAIFHVSTELEEKDGAWYLKLGQYSNALLAGEVVEERPAGQADAPNFGKIRQIGPTGGDKEEELLALEMAMKADDPTLKGAALHTLSQDLWEKGYRAL